MNFRWSKRDRDHLISAYRNGCSIEELADHYDKTEQCIRSTLSAWGACNRQRRLTEEERGAIMKMIEAGIPDEEIGRKFDRSRSRIAMIRKKVLGISRPMGRRKR